MINIQDYKAYLLHNFNFLELLKENNSLVYDRLQDVFKVLGFIEIMVDEKKGVDEDFEVIFEVGFTYIHEQLEEIKTYYDNYFKRDYPSFVKYEKFINYLLYINDLEEVLKEKSLFSNEVKRAINEISEKIEDILIVKKEPNEEIFDKFNLILEQYVPVGTLTTLEIYGMIVEELQI